MPGLFGIFTPGVRGQAEPTARRMLESMRHHAWYGAALHVDELSELAWGKVTLSPAPAAIRRAVVDGRSVLLEGEIYDYAEHRRQLERRGVTFTGDEPAELVARGLAMDGEAF